MYRAEPEGTPSFIGVILILSFTMLMVRGAAWATIAVWGDVRTLAANAEAAPAVPPEATTIRTKAAKPAKNPSPHRRRHNRWSPEWQKGTRREYRSSDLCEWTQQPPFGENWVPFLVVPF